MRTPTKLNYANEQDCPQENAKVKTTLVPVESAPQVPCALHQLLVLVLLHLELPLALHGDEAHLGFAHAGHLADAAQRVVGRCCDGVDGLALRLQVGLVLAPCTLQERLVGLACDSAQDVALLDSGDLDQRRLRGGVCPVAVRGGGFCHYDRRLVLLRFRLC